MKLKSLIKKIELKYPLSLAYDWDNVGLLVGDYEMDIKRVLVVLEANEKVIEEAIKNNIDLIITHHPFIFKKINKVNTSDLKGKLIHKLIKNDVALYSMHTNFDIAFDGLNDYFMEIMGFEDTKILDITNIETLYKIVVYVPTTHAENLRKALANAGAGHIGNYSHCTFNCEGIGTFKPLDGSSPFIGVNGQVEKVNEIKIETIVPQNILGGVISSMLKAHPYEEVAYDIYRLENKGQSVGLGRLSKLKQNITLEKLSNNIKEKLKMDYIRIVGNFDNEINKVAVVTGSGADMVKKAKRQGAQVIITGDVKYHDAQDALDIGMNIIDCGHFDTEDIFKDVMKRFLDTIDEIEVIKSNINLNPFKTI
ncbi:Nif3-like dinuclear metal center hexameric protein [Romboutsia maritimum]|uniref:GTP cyclohydrolase 1 type 2 homolog n=1 Tax=Romboutsia maritimum TaxID=2020948 RepID=A0A371IVY2_9FIRM|nr:Nif3-like dinuclear metal center hexameric protein [Romboutsia maritimum]RDY24628.1 Nif3-like dinuclear metal center hexameric protein [Romboutsia maritimum]